MNKANMYIYIYIYIHIYTYTYTVCPRRKGPNFGRVFLRSNYTDITQNTYTQSSMVTEILAEKSVDFFGVCVLYLSVTSYSSYLLDFQRESYSGLAERKTLS